MTCCRIQWIDAFGKPTPDTNPAIGEVWLPARVQQIQGRGVPFPASERYPICEHHAKRLSDPGMEWWRFEAYPVSGRVAVAPTSEGFEVLLDGERWAHTSYRASADDIGRQLEGDISRGVVLRKVTLTP